jgi:hypothetical protein
MARKFAVNWASCNSFWAGTLLLGTVSVMDALAESIALNPSADATLFEVAPTNAAGGAGYFISGTTQNQTRNRALLQFDITGAIPSGAQITSVTLELEVIRQPGCGFEPSFFGLHRVLQSWGEGTSVPMDNPGGKGGPAGPGDATWSDRFTPSIPWTAPGGAAGTDYTPEFSSATAIYGLGVYDIEGTSEMINDVQYWLEHPTLNHGWMLISESEDTPFTARMFASRENLDGGAPVLFIDYEPVPEPSTWVLLTTGGLALALWLRGRRKASFAVQAVRRL